jgi:serine/threonine protein kinase
MMSAKLPGIIAGKYECVALVGRGGMGTVYKALQKSLGRTVAVKMLSEELASDIEFRARFRQEAEIVGRMNHPNIVAVYDIEPHNHTFCIIMEFVDGESLQAKIDRRAAMSETEVASIGAQVARALHYAHGFNVVHRDIKPDNIIVTPQGQAKITDFGIARFMESKFKTQTGVSMGTPRFMSPEQVTGKGVDAQSDLYSLGVCLYYCLAGQPPFDGENPIAIATKHLYEQPPPLSQINPAVTPAMEKVIMRALEKSRDLRFATGEQMAEALEAVIQGRAAIRIEAGSTAAPVDPTRRMESSPAIVPVRPAPELPDRPASRPQSAEGAPATAPSAPPPTPSRGANPSSTRSPFDTTAQISRRDGRYAELMRLAVRWWPALGALVVIVLALVYASLSNRLWSDQTTGGGEQSVAAEYRRVMSEVSTLLSEGKIMQAREMLITFASTHPSYDRQKVAMEIDRLTAQLPLSQPDSALIVAERRDRRGKEFFKDPERYHLARAYLVAARDLYRGTRGSYPDETFIQLLDRNLTGTALARGADAATSAARLAELARERAALVGAVPDAQVERDLIGAIHLAPESYAYWLALADYYLSTGFTDDARVLLQHVERSAPQASEERRRAGQTLRQLNA